MNNEQLRIGVIDNKYFLKELKQHKRELFEKYGHIFTYKTLTEQLVEDFKDCYPVDYILEGIKHLDNCYHRRQRCLDKTTQIVDACEDSYFGTLTFTDEVLNKTNIETRRKYVTRFLKSISNSYLANIDFGDKEKNPQSNEREHYHCLINCEHLPTGWKYGFCKFLKVRRCEEDKQRVSKYIAKLTNHSLKVERTGKARRLIYSRGSYFPQWLLE